MKISLITDTHFGARGDSLMFNEFFFKFWENTFFPYIEKHKITNIIHLGDVVDRRKFVNYVILNSFRTRFMNVLKDMNVTMDVLVGNHDIPYKNTNEINAIQELFGEYKNVNIISSPITKTYDDFPIALIPWINSSNYDETMQFVKDTSAQIAMTHLELQGFQMDKGNVCESGMSRDLFKKFETVYCGHFHHKSTDGHIYYLGNTYEITWADYGDRRGFHILDTNTRELEFIENPYRMFHKVFYDDSQETLESVSNKDFSEYKDTYVKVIVARKDNTILFDKFMDQLYKIHPADISIVENHVDITSISEDDIIDQSDDTVSILNKTIDNLEIDLDKSILKNTLREIYLEAHNTEN